MPDKIFNDEEIADMTKQTLDTSNTSNVETITKKELPPATSKFSNRPDVAETPIITYFTSLITGEQTLINNRITWLMTFQGFLFATFAVATSKDSSADLQKIIYNVIPLTGFFVALFTIVGLFAAYSAIDEIKKKFSSLNYTQWATPYSSRRPSIAGRIAAFSFPIIIIVTWAFIFFNFIPFQGNISIQH